MRGISLSVYFIDIDFLMHKPGLYTHSYIALIILAF